MAVRAEPTLRTHLAAPRPPFERIALVLQGGGALGAYQAGVYQALAEAHLHPDWVAGISIGAIASAIIAGNAPERRVERLRAFWETVSEAPLGTEVLGLLPEAVQRHLQLISVARRAHRAAARCARCRPSVKAMAQDTSETRIIHQSPETIQPKFGWTVRTDQFQLYRTRGR